MRGSAPESSPEVHFVEALEDAILAALEHGPATFAWLAEHVEGAFPSDTRNSLAKMVAEGRVGVKDGLFFVESAPGEVASSPRPFVSSVEHDLLPSPHPADFDWRFTQPTARFLARLARTLGDHRPIALFGTPTVYQALLRESSDITLFERNAEMIRCLPRTEHAFAIETDLLGLAHLPTAKYGLVVADPPWYSEYYRAFAQHAAAALVEGGVLILSVLPRLTRPGAHLERKALFELLLELGFELCSYAPNKLRYRTPPFEHLSLRAEGLACGDWRRADIGIFRLGGAQNSEERLLPLPAAEPTWDSFRLPLRSVRVRRRSTYSLGSFWYRPLGANGAVLPTVSRRHTIRDRIDVWSDLNEAWEVSSVDVVRAALESMTLAPHDATAAVMAARDTGATAEDVAQLIEFLEELRLPPRLPDAA